uniref:Uncharacterized protein n=1 Tax=Pararge aegeria TaxID=116150 RepID=S4NR52_9NEOP
MCTKELALLTLFKLFGCNNKEWTTQQVAMCRKASPKRSLLFCQSIRNPDCLLGYEPLGFVLRLHFIYALLGKDVT